MNEDIKNEVAAEEKVETQPEKKEEVKTFTQEELNKVVQERLAKEKKKYPNKERLQAFDTWEETQKTETEKVNDKINSYEEKIKEHENNYSSLKFENLALKKDIKTDSIKDVFILSKSYTSEDVDMGEAIEKVLEKYPQFRKVITTTTNTTVKHEPGETKKEKVAIMDMTTEEYYESLGMKPFNKKFNK